MKGKGKQREEKNKLNGPCHRKQDIPWSFEIKTLMYYCMYTYNLKFRVSPPKLLLDTKGKHRLQERGATDFIIDEHSL